MTEEEAKMKICPILSWNGPQRPCIAGSCVLWETTSVHSYKRRIAERKTWPAPVQPRGDYSEPPRPLDVPSDAVWAPGGFDGDEWYGHGCWMESDISREGRQRIFDASDNDRVNAGRCKLGTRL